MVARAAGYCSDVEFSPMDATRSDRQFVYWMLEQCIEAGATDYLAKPVDTALPADTAARIARCRARSRAWFGTPVAEVQRQIARRHG